MADILSRPDPIAFGQAVCEAIDALPFSTTASVGTATIADHQQRDLNPEQLLDDLVVMADTAMYAAKRDGGNHAEHTVVDPDRSGWGPRRPLVCCGRPQRPQPT